MKSTEANIERPQGSTCSYDGYLVFAKPVPDLEKRIKAVADAAGLQVDVGNNSIEFRYEGRDSNQFVVKFLTALAGIVGTASGEIRCQVTTDEGDPIFEFFRIKNSHLFMQRASLVRGVEEELGAC